MYLAISYLITIVAVFLSVCTGNTEICDFDNACLPIYNNFKGSPEEQRTDMSTLCSMSQDLKDCMKKQSKKCRGNLNFHFFEKLVRDLMSNTSVGKNCSGGGNRSASGSGTTRPATRNFPNAPDKCTPRVKSDSRSVGCALFGLTNVKSFSETLNYTDINYCYLAGAWSLIDTPEFAVQITNKAGWKPLPRDITTTTLVTVIIKNNQCSERKTYQATFEEVPGMFTDGSSTAGNVFLETMKESEHVKIHFPYLVTTINVIKVNDRLPIPSLTVVIKMPQVQANAFMTEPSRLRGLPLCFYGCPKTATMKPRSTDSSSSRPSNYYRSNCPGPDHEESSLEFLNSGGSVSGSDICASLNSVQTLLADSTIVAQRLAFPGEENFGSSSDSSIPDSTFINVENSALTSQSSGLTGYRSLFLYFSVVVLLVLTS